MMKRQIRFGSFITGVDLLCCAENLSQLFLRDSFAFASLSQVDGVITDQDLDEEGNNLLKKYNTRVIFA